MFCLEKSVSKNLQERWGQEAANLFHISIMKGLQVKQINKNKKSQLIKQRDIQRQEQRH